MNSNPRTRNFTLLITGSVLDSASPIAGSLGSLACPPVQKPRSSLTRMTLIRFAGFESRVIATVAQIESAEKQ